LISEEWIGVDEPERWNSALRSIPHSYWHGWRPCFAASVNTGNPVYLYVAREDEHIVLCPLMERQWQGYRDYTTPVGFSGFAASLKDFPERFIQRWSAALRDRGAICAYLAQHPLFAPVSPAIGKPEGSTLFVIDLAAPSIEWLKQIDENRRRSIRAWEDMGSPWIRDRPQLTRFVVEHHSAAMKSFNASAASYYSNEALQLLCDDPHVEMVGAADQDGLCSVAAFGSGGWGSELMFHISIRGGRSYTAALMWWAVRHFHGRVPAINLGGTPRENDTLAAAKRRYRPRELILRKLKAVIDQPLYERLCQDAKVRADDHSGYFPAYRQGSSSR
jgi:hypothetical protein